MKSKLVLQPYILLIIFKELKRFCLKYKQDNNIILLSRIQIYSFEPTLSLPEQKQTLKSY